MKRVDDRRVLSGIVRALKCGGRWVERDIWEDISARLPGPKMHRTSSSSTAVSSRFIAVVRRKRGGLGQWYPWWARQNEVVAGIEFERRWIAKQCEVSRQLEGIFKSLP